MTTMAPFSRSPRMIVYHFIFATLLTKNVVISFAPTVGPFGRSTTQSRSPFITTSLAVTGKTIINDVDAPVSFIDTELRDAAMKLHTRKQAPKEGKAPEKRETEPYVTTHADYLAFLVDSQYVYEAMEEAVNANESLKQFRNTGMERTKPLETDIQFMVNEYGIARPDVSKIALDYANLVRKLAMENKVPELICHFYNHYFAHTAGGMMIGKRMSELLLDNKTLEFYKWEGDISEIKATVKRTIEELVLTWSPEERKRCVKATGAAFKGGGGINANLRGGKGKR